MTTATSLAPITIKGTITVRSGIVARTPRSEVMATNPDTHSEKNPQTIMRTTVLIIPISIFAPPIFTYYPRRENRTACHSAVAAAAYFGLPRLDPTAGFISTIVISVWALSPIRSAPAVFSMPCRARRGPLSSGSASNAPMIAWRTFICGAWGLGILGCWRCWFHAIRALQNITRHGSPASAAVAMSTLKSIDIPE